MYRKDDLKLVEGDHCAAIVLNLLREWQVDAEWIDATHDEIRAEMDGLFSRNRIIAALKLLREKELVRVRNNPDFGQVRTLQYQVTAKGGAK
jgi:hypothetical protein